MKSIFPELLEEQHEIINSKSVREQIEEDMELDEFQVIWWAEIKQKQNVNTSKSIVSEHCAANNYNATDLTVSSNQSLQKKTNSKSAQKQIEEDMELDEFQVIWWVEIKQKQNVNASKSIVSEHCAANNYNATDLTVSSNQSLQLSEKQTDLDILRNVFAKKDSYSYLCSIDVVKPMLERGIELNLEIVKLAFEAFEIQVRKLSPFENFKKVSNERLKIYSSKTSSYILIEEYLLKNPDNISEDILLFWFNNYRLWPAFVPALLSKREISEKLVITAINSHNIVKDSETFEKILDKPHNCSKDELDALIKNSQSITYSSKILDYIKTKLQENISVKFKKDLKEIKNSLVKEYMSQIILVYKLFNSSDLDKINDELIKSAAKIAELTNSSINDYQVFLGRFVTKLKILHEEGNQEKLDKLYDNIKESGLGELLNSMKNLEFMNLQEVNKDINIKEAEEKQIDKLQITVNLLSNDSDYETNNASNYVVDNNSTTDLMAEDSLGNT